MQNSCENIVNEMFSSFLSRQSHTGNIFLSNQTLPATTAAVVATIAIPARVHITQSTISHSSTEKLFHTFL